LERVLLDEASIVLVGDVDAFGGDLEAAGLGRIVIERDEVPGAPGPEAETEIPGPVDDPSDTGPTAGAEKTDGAGSGDAADEETGPDTTKG
jgi:hypothetical protein